ncbi:MAG TPA: lysophospholipid acyltransferase family protein [Caulobacteraceae bacterium]|nr:lysophospholipid acyltransferase family protein [Caulobacteraceae bacterium]
MVKKKRVKRKLPGWLQTCVYAVEVVLYDLFHLIVGALPPDAASDMGAWIGGTFGPLSPTNRIVKRNLDLAFPDKSPQERHRILMAQWRNTGRLFAEFPILHKLTPATGRVEVINGERLDAIREAGKPVVFVSGHFSNWEIMPLTIVHYGVVCEMTYRAANNPWVDKRIKDSRARYGVRLFAPKGGDGSRELLKGMMQGASVALMNDQKFNRGLAVPFFGHDAFTAPGPTRLALKFGTVLQTMTVRRLKGARFQAIVHEPIELERTGDKARDIELGVRRISAFVEEEVRHHPDDWFWVHKRWPNEAYAASVSAREDADDEDADDSR